MYAQILTSLAAEHVKDLQAEAAAARRARTARRARHAAGPAVSVAADAPALDRPAYQLLPCPDVIANC